MPWKAALIGGGASLLGGIFGGNSAADAANTSAQAQLEAARIAAEEARFRPVGVTSRFGQSNFQFNPEGRLTGAGYTLDPQIKAYQDRMLGLTGGGLDQAAMAQQQFAPLGQAAQGLFGLGQQYLAQSPQDVSQNYINSQMALLQPSRDVNMANLRNRLDATGRTGLSVAQGGVLGSANPEMQAYYNAQAQQDAMLAANAQQAGQQNVAFGAGLFGTGGNLLTQGYGGQVSALSPYQAYLQGATGLESLGQQTLDTGIGLGKGNVASSQALMTGGMGAANAMYKSNAYNPFAEALLGASKNERFTTGLEKLFNRPVNSGFGAGGYGAGVNPNSGEYMGSLEF